VLEAENEVIVQSFLARFPEFVLCSAQEILDRQEIAIDVGERLRLLPQHHGTDAFYGAVMERK
jgi:16S rRNA (cytosine967-C5)-methyltransferase